MMAINLTEEDVDQTASQSYRRLPVQEELPQPPIPALLSAEMGSLSLPKHAMTTTRFHLTVVLQLAKCLMDGIV